MNLHPDADVYAPPFQFESFQAFPLRHGMSYRIPEAPSEGDVGYGIDANWEHVTANRTRFLYSVAIVPEDLVVPRQTHGNSVLVATEADRGNGQPPKFAGFSETDGLVTAVSTLAIGIIVADCVPILLYDPVRHVAGVVHAGWRGTVGQIASVGVDLMQERFGTRPRDVYAGIGPSIGPCCYEVGDEVIEQWLATPVPDNGHAVLRRRSRDHLDLWSANRLVLQGSGVPNQKIEIARSCTKCMNDRFFSHRAATTGNGTRGRMIMAAQLH